MGALAAIPCGEDEESVSQAIIASLDENFPSNWRDWKVYNYTFEDLFGSSQVPSGIEAKLRFAIPTVDLARAFKPSSTSLSDRSYRAIRAAILKWPLGRALLYAPHNLMEKIHSPSYEVFMNAVRELKPKLAKRREASRELERFSPTSGVPSAGTKRMIESSAEEHSEAKRSSYTNTLSSPIRSGTRGAPTQGSSEHLLASVLSQQMLLFNKMLSMQSEQNENIKTVIQNQQRSATPSIHQSCEEDLNKSYDSLPDSTQSEEEKDDQVQESGNFHQWPDTQEDNEADLRKKIADAQRELASLGERKCANITTFDFTPTTTEQEPKMARAEPLAVKHGLSCQRLGESSWCNVRYATQKQFQATPVFTSLKTNNLLVEITPNWKSSEVLEKSDLTLGAITNGLIQQRMIFQNLLDSLPTDIKNIVGRDFVAANSEFRKNSDALLQYVCGRRAEVIKQRREVYKPPNKAFRNILHDIPPSGTHLFEDKSLTEVVKELGGVHKLFPNKRKQYTNRKTIPQVAKPKSAQTNNHRFRDSRHTTKRNPPHRGGDGKEYHQKPFPPKQQQGKKDGAGRK